MCRPSHVWRILNQHCIRKSLAFAVPSAALASAIKITNDNLEWNYLNEILPNSDAYKLFASTVSLLVVFRAVQAMNRYNEGAKAAYHMTGAWFDAASTLFAFTRSATVPIVRVRNFKNTMVRLFSLMSMLCLEELENCEDDGRSRALKFIVIDVEGLDPAMLQIVRNSKCKAEAVCQLIQCIIVDNIGTGVLAIPPPILSRAFQDLGTGMLKYHETLPIARVSVPFPLKAVCECLGIVYALFTPFVMALWTKGPLGAAWVTFAQVCVLFTLNQLALEVENPFSGNFQEIDMELIHHQFNIRLASLNWLSHSSFGQIDDTLEDDLHTKRPSSWEDSHKVQDTCRESIFASSLSSLSASEEVKRKRATLAKKANRVDAVIDRFLVRSQGRAEKRRDVHVHEIEALLSATPGSFHMKTSQHLSIHGDLNQEGNHEGLRISMLPRTPERPPSPELDDEISVDLATGPTVRLTMIPCSAPAQNSFNEEPLKGTEDV